MKKSTQYPLVSIYSDGATKPNPGKGGFGVIMRYKAYEKEFFQGFNETTNNRMELMGVIHGFENLKRTSIVSVYSDSRYVVNGISNGWAEKWKKNNWIKSDDTIVQNFDLWDKLLDLISQHRFVTFKWIRGHSGHPENERCDFLANLAIQSDNLLEDNGYISHNYSIDKEIDNLIFQSIKENNPRIWQDCFFNV